MMRRLLMTLIVLFPALPCWGVDIIAATDAPADWKAAADATCNGTDDDVEIQAALTAVAADGGGTVTLSPGNFAVSTVLLIDDNVTLVGQGNATILTYGAHAADATPVIGNVDYAAGSNSGIVIRDLYINGNSPNQVGWDATWDPKSLTNRGAIHFRTVSDFKIMNVSIYQPYNTGIELEGCTNGLVRGNRVVDSKDDGIGVNDSSSEIVVEGNQILDMCTTAIYGGPSGIEVQDTSSKVVVANNVIRHTDADNTVSCIQVNDHSGTASNAVSITGNQLSIGAGAALGYGINLSGDSSSQEVWNITITGNTFTIASATCRGITGVNAKNVMVVGNAFNMLAAAYCIRPTGTMSNVLVANNVFAGAGSAYGISCTQTGTFTNWTISENMFLGTDYVSAIGISNSASTFTNWLLRGNTIIGPNFAFRYNADSTMTNFRVIDNHIAPDSYIAYDDKATAGDRQPAGWEVRGNSGGSALTQALISNSFEKVRNTSGGSLTAGMVVVLKSAATGFEVTTTTTLGDRKVYGVIADASIANNAFGRVQTSGKVTTLKVNGTVDIAVGDLLTTSAVAGVGRRAISSQGAFAVALEAYSTDDDSGVIDAILIGSPQRRLGGTNRIEW